MKSKVRARIRGNLEAIPETMERTDFSLIIVAYDLRFGFISDNDCLPSIICLFRGVVPAAKTQHFFFHGRVPIVAT